jgi:predicted transcriptional regulator
MSMQAIRVKVDEDQLAELDRLAAERRQSRSTLGGLLLEAGLTAALATEPRPVERLTA